MDDTYGEAHQGGVAVGGGPAVVTYVSPKVSVRYYCVDSYVYYLIENGMKDEFNRPKTMTRRCLDR